MDGGTGGATGAADAGAAARTPLWRPRPPRRPRRLRRRSGPVSEVCAAADPTAAAAGCSKTDSCSPSFISCSVSLGCSSENSAMIGSNRFSGSAEVSLTAAPVVAAGVTGIGAPRRTSPSSAFCFHCGRRKRSAAVVYQRTASEVVSAFSYSCASSNATMASCVRSYNADSWPGGSALVRALRMRAWICRQSLTGRYCNSRAHAEP